MDQTKVLVAETLSHFLTRRLLKALICEPHKLPCPIPPHIVTQGEPTAALNAGG